MSEADMDNYTTMYVNAVGKQTHFSLLVMVAQQSTMSDKL